MKLSEREMAALSDLRTAIDEVLVSDAPTAWKNMRGAMARVNEAHSNTILLQGLEEIVSWSGDSSEGMRNTAASTIEQSQSWLQPV